MLKSLGCYCSSSVGELGVFLRYPSCQTFSVAADFTAPVSTSLRQERRKAAADDSAFSCWAGGAGMRGGGTGIGKEEG